MGSEWRMPTNSEQDELRNNCTWEWTTQNGVNGYKVTGDNGNCIFLPAAGSRMYSFLNNTGSIGSYWSSTLGESYPEIAYDLCFFSGQYGWETSDRYFGFSVRAVLRSE